MEMKQIQAEVLRINTVKGWMKTSQSPLEACMLIVTEVAELAEAARRGCLKDPCDKDPSLTCEQEEIADIIIRALDYANRSGFDAGEAVRAKLRINEGRAYRHGGKVI